MTDGHCWIRLGTFSPEGTRVSVNYSGGYTLGTPPSLRRACCMQAAKNVILDFEPQQRKGQDLTELDEQIDKILIPWAKG